MFQTIVLHKNLCIVLSLIFIGVSPLFSSNYIGISLSSNMTIIDSEDGDSHLSTKPGWEIGFKDLFFFDKNETIGIECSLTVGSIFPFSKSTFTLLDMPIYDNDIENSEQTATSLRILSYFAKSLKKKNNFVAFGIGYSISALDFPRSYDAGVFIRYSKIETIVDYGIKDPNDAAMFFSMNIGLPFGLHYEANLDDDNFEGSLSIRGLSLSVGVNLMLNNNWG